jgi:hypothetical protein
MAAVVERPVHELGGNTTPLGGRVDGQQVDLTRPRLVVEHDRDEAECDAVDCSDPGVVTAQCRPDGRLLFLSPIRMEPSVQPPAEDALERCEHGCPRGDRQLDDAIGVALGEAADGEGAHGRPPLIVGVQAEIIAPAIAARCS